MVRRFQKKRKKSVQIPEAIVTIDSVGVKGDGIARDESGNLLFIPYVLQGEVVRVKPIKKRGDGFACRLEEIITESENRIEPICKHFTECGGCKLQHMSNADQKLLKKRFVAGAFYAHNEEVAVNDVIHVVNKRRRARFIIKRVGQTYEAGFHKIQSNSIVPISECHIVDAELLSMVKKMLPVFKNFDAPHAMDCHITKGTNGIEVVLYPFEKGELSFETREILTEAVNSFGLTGLYWHWDGSTDPVCVKQDLIIDFSGINVDQPPAGFLQPSDQGQIALVSCVDDMIVKYAEKQTKNRIADLYAGSGSFSYPLCKFGSVEAFELNTFAVNSLNKGSGTLPLQGFERDLEHKPLTKEECDVYDIIVLDPVRRGANEQCCNISLSDCPIVIYVSCNPTVLAKDSKELLSGGYELKTLTPIDQFMHSEHCEAIAVFSKEKS